jgi:hypothetical protein
MKRRDTQKKATTVLADDPEALKGTLKHIGGSQSDNWNNILAACPRTCRILKGAKSK